MRMYHLDFDFVQYAQNNPIIRNSFQCTFHLQWIMKLDKIKQRNRICVQSIFGLCTL